MLKKIILTGLIFLYIAAAFVNAEEKSLTIGVSGVYTGGFAAAGKNVSDGKTDYLSWRNAQGGIVYNDPISGKTEHVMLNMIKEDNQYNAAKAVAVYNQFKLQGANAIIGFGSTPGQACAAKASQDKLPYFSWYSYASPSGYKPEPQYYWSFLPTIAESATPMIKWFIHQKWQGTEPPKIGIMAANVPSWQVLGKSGMMDEYVKSVGGRLVEIEFIPLVTTDLTATLAKLVFEKKADGLILISALSQTVVVAKDMQRMGINPKKIPLICNVSAWDESLFQSIPTAIEGLYGEVHVASADQDVPGMKTVKTVAKWAGRDPDNIVFNYTNGMVGAMILETAIKRALEKHGYEKVAQSGEVIRDEFHNFKPFDPLGLAPPIEVKYADQPYFLNYARIVEAKKGKFVYAGDWVSIDRIKGSLE